MKDLLTNPVYNALVSGDKHLGFGKGNARSFYEDVSPFAGFEEKSADGFNDLYHLLAPGQYTLLAIPEHINIPDNWKLIEKVEGVQMIHRQQNIFEPLSPVDIVPLNKADVPEMLKLARLTKPGPFGTRTIEFGNYFGVFENKQLVAMAGQRMHVEQYSEISAVCTHPDFLGKQYATALVQHQLQLIYQENKTPFLHVRGDNERAISIYQRLGFEIRRPMNFYFIKKRKSVQDRFNNFAAPEE